jgi:hypothetical protein
MTKEYLIKKLNDLRDTENYANEKSANTAYWEGVVDSIDLITVFFDSNEANKDEVNSALSIIIKVSANMLTNRASEYIEEYDLPKSMSKETKRKIINNAILVNEINRKRSIELSKAHEILSKYINENK